MKKIIIAGILAISPIMAQADTGPGCGLGATLFEGKDGIASNVLAATTNGIAGNQTFGMSTGTLGCDGEKTVTLSSADTYLDANMEQVAHAMATGSGEALDTLAALFGINGTDKAAFSSVTRDNFATIFAKDNTSSTEVMASLKAVMAADTTLAKYIS